MWTLGEDAIALSHADATSVFVALKPDESSFEEAIDGAGLATNEPADRVRRVVVRHAVASWTQITPATRASVRGRRAPLRVATGSRREGASAPPSSRRAAAPPRLYPREASS